MSASLVGSEMCIRDRGGIGDLIVTCTSTPVSYTHLTLPTTPYV
ncbi:hypothetical protein JMUB7538_27370 [Staphylococcus aureus]